jgi:hypothetical protein
MQTESHVDQQPDLSSLNTLAANINRRLECWYATGLVPPLTVGAAGLWLGCTRSWLLGALISFAAFVLMLAVWYRAVLRPVSRREASRLAHAVDGDTLVRLANQTQWPILKHALQILQCAPSVSAVQRDVSTVAHSRSQEK